MKALNNVQYIIIVLILKGYSDRNLETILSSTL